MITQRLNNTADISDMVGISQMARLSTQAESMSTEAERLESVLDFNGAAHCRMGAAVLFGKAGSEDRGRQEWGIAADMFEATINAKYSIKGLTCKLTTNDLKHLLYLSEKVCEASEKSASTTGQKLLDKYSTISISIRGALDAGRAPKWEELMR